LKQYIDEPPSFEDGKSAADLLRRKPTARPPQEWSSSENSSSSDSDSDGSKKPHKPTKKRKRHLDDAELETRREKRRLVDLEKREMIKSAVRIMDSDDDEDADREFFEKERELRGRMAEKALEGDIGGTQRPQKAPKKPRKRKTQAAPKATEEEIFSDVEIVRDIEDQDSLGMGSETGDGVEDVDSQASKPTVKRRKILSISSDEE
jgi:replication fork protection complex subunit Tof1/Swi1